MLSQKCNKSAVPNQMSNQKELTNAEHTINSTQNTSGAQPSGSRGFVATENATNEPQDVLTRRLNEQQASGEPLRQYPQWQQCYPSVIQGIPWNSTNPSLPQNTRPPIFMVYPYSNCQLAAFSHCEGCLRNRIAMNPMNYSHVTYPFGHMGQTIMQVPVYNQTPVNPELLQQTQLGQQDVGSSGQLSTTREPKEAEEKVVENQVTLEKNVVPTTLKINDAMEENEKNGVEEKNESEDEPVEININFNAEDREHLQGLKIKVEKTVEEDKQPNEQISGAKREHSDESSQEISTIFDSRKRGEPLKKMFKVNTDLDREKDTANSVFVKKQDTANASMSNIKKFYLRKKVRKWSVVDVYDFIRDIPGCEEYAEIFFIHEVDGEALLLLTPDHMLTAMSVKLGHAVKLIAKLNTMKSESESEDDSD